MNQDNSAMLATFVGETICAGVIAVLLFGFYRQYGKSYLRNWTLGWASLSVHHAAEALALYLSLEFKLEAINPWLLILVLIGAVAGYLHIGWFVFGVYELILRRPVRFRHYQVILTVLASAGLITSLLFLDASPLSIRQLIAREGVRSLTAAVIFMGAGIALWRGRRRRSGLGFSILGSAFVFWALQHLNCVIRATTGRPFDYTGHMGYIDFVLQALMGVGMVACLLEDEREAAELASAEIEHLAYHDALTGLPNRPLFIDRMIVALAHAARGSHKLAVLFLDLDRFKDINDSLGHSVGDTLLKAVSDRIRRCLREGDTVARFGGDEFTLLIPRIDHIEDAAKIAQKIIETLKIPFRVQDRELFATTSIGISLYPTDGLDPETLVRNADAAMYRAKDQGRDNYQLYAPAMNARALERLALENRLRRALGQNELVLHYQPLIDVETRSIVGLEALIRWNHPELGLLSPAHFISVAEVSGLIIPIGSWVMITACKQLRQWQKKFDADLIVAVNLSARQFQQPDLVEQVKAAIDESRVNPASLELEITESNAMQNAENTIYALRELKTLGVRIAMDDFGTGYSSLNYLKRFPIDTLKLDQTFIRDVTTDASDAAIVSAVITMAHSLKLEVVAEGVEREEQLEFLTKERCDRVQGYLFGKPKPVEELEPLLAERRPLSTERSG